MATSTFGRLWKNEYFQTAVMILFIVALVFGFWYGTRLVLNTDYPMLAVASGSMHMPVGTYCDGWSHPFARTLHTGDIIIVQGVNASDIHAGPNPEGDIIVFRRLTSIGEELIVHRAIRKIDRGGAIYFVTKGDGNSNEDPEVSGDRVIGKVIMRIPWVGHFALYIHNSNWIMVIIVLIIVLIVIEFVLPMLTSKKPESDQNEHKERVPESEGPI